MLLLCVLLTACYFIVDEIEGQDLVGVWVEDREDCENELSGCAWLEFTENGHFKATNIPSDYFGYFPFSSNAKFDASGVWEIELSSDPLGNHKINLRFDPVPLMNYPVYNDTLYVVGKKGGFNLFAWHGDPSNRIDFIKLSEEGEANSVNHRFDKKGIFGKVKALKPTQTKEAPTNDTAIRAKS